MRVPKSVLAVMAVGAISGGVAVVALSNGGGFCATNASTDPTGAVQQSAAPQGAPAPSPFRWLAQWFSRADRDPCPACGMG